ncbi:MAG: carbohydrate ABC transporter permease [Thermomicrobiales bacterium]|jgi:multiple sugar transport system permease protein
MSGVGHQRSRWDSLVLYLIIAVYVVVVTFPFYYMVLTSLRTPHDVYQRTEMLTPRNLTGRNYGYVLQKTDFALWVRNSVVVAFGSTFLALVISVLAAYSLARLRYRGARTIAKSVLFMYLVPSSLLFIPLFLLMSALGLTNSLWGLIVAYLTFNVPFCTWLLLGYFRSLPAELEEAARIDGCSHLGVLWRIVLPVAGPGVITAFIFGFINSWNEFLYAAVLVQRSPLRTFPVGFYSFIIGDVLLWGPMMADAVMVTVPTVILFMVVQRYVVQGLTAGSVKG